MMVCSIGAIIVFYRTQSNPGSSERVHAHIFIEFLSLVSLLVISPLSYPALIDDYEECLDDNPLMRYDIFICIQITFFIAMGFVSLQLLLFQHEHILIEKYGKNLYNRCFYTSRNFTGAILCGFFMMSLFITFGTNTLLIFASIVLDSCIGFYTLYRDALQNKDISDLLPINPKNKPDI